MKRPGKVFLGGFGSTVDCPFCGFSTDLASANPACGGCYVEFYENRKGEIVFDTLRHTEMGQRYAVARAFSGMSLGEIAKKGNP
jgi:hypothetical protein